MGELWGRLLAAFKKPLVWWVVVAEWEQGVRVRLGRHSARLDPGVHFRLPFLDRVYVQSVRLRTIEDAGVTVQAADGKTVVVSYALSFSIVDMLRFYKTMASPEATLTAKASARIVEYVAAQESGDISPSVIERSCELVDAEAFGLSPIEVRVTGVTTCRAYRLLSAAWRGGTGLGDLDEAGER